jgi:hypothetical protein
MALFAAGGAALAAWTAMRWTASPSNPSPWSPAWIAAGLFLLTAACLLAAALRPAIEIHETHLVIGRRLILWGDIRRVDQTVWNVPLAVYLTLADQRRELLLYPGDPDTCAGLLRQLRRFSREALIDGIPHRQFWGESATAEPKQLPPARYPLLRPEDEEEVERMFHRLKSVGRIDQRNSDDK